MILFSLDIPFFFRQYTVFDIGNSDNYFDDNRNKEYMAEISENILLPFTEELLSKVRDGKKAAVFLSESSLALMTSYSSSALDGFKALAGSGAIEFVNGVASSFNLCKAGFNEHVSLQKKGLLSIGVKESKIFYSDVVNDKSLKFISQNYVITNNAPKGLFFDSGKIVLVPSFPIVNLLVDDWRVAFNKIDSETIFDAFSGTPHKGALFFEREYKNKLQKGIAEALYTVGTKLKNKALRTSWIRLHSPGQADWLNYGKTNPYGNAYDSYIAYKNITEDLIKRGDLCDNEIKTILPKEESGLSSG